MTQFLFPFVFGSAYDKYIALPASDTRGGVLIAWKGSSCQAVASMVDTYYVSVMFSERQDRNLWFTLVYGPQRDEEKVLFLQKLRNCRALDNGPWLVAGDSNLIYQAANKNNANLDRAMMGRFRRFLDDTEIKEYLCWAANTHGLMRGGHPRWFAWIVLSVVLSGKAFFLNQFCRAQQQVYLITVHSSLA